MAKMATMATMGLADLLVFPYIAGLRRFAGFSLIFPFFTDLLVSPYIAGLRRFAGFPYIAGLRRFAGSPPLYWRFAPICWFSPVFTDLLVSSYIAGLRRFAGFPYIAGFRRFAGFPPYIGASRRFAGFPLYCRFSPISRLSRGSRGQFRQIRSRMRVFFGQFRIITGVGAVHTLPRHCMSYLSPEGGVLRHFWPIFGCFRPYFHLIRAGPSMGK